MKNIILMFVVLSFIACKKDSKEELVESSWQIKSITVSPAITMGSKTSTDYMALSGEGSCAATMILNFSKDGVFTSGSNGALCDQLTQINTPILTWNMDGDKIIVSSNPNNPYILNGKKLTQTVISKNPNNGIEYTYTYSFSSK